MPSPQLHSGMCGHRPCCCAASLTKLVWAATAAVQEAQQRADAYAAQEAEAKEEAEARRAAEARLARAKEQVRPRPVWALQSHRLSAE